MSQPLYTISYDVGTTGVKTCLFAITDKIELLAAASEGYNLYVLEDGGAEQDPDEWWAAMCKSTRTVMGQSSITKEQVAGISFCSQMQGLVLVDKEGNAVRRAMSYMDQRARAELKAGIAHGPQIAGANVFKLLKALSATGAVACSVKDPVWKYKWVEAHEPENFKRVHKWLDVKEYLIGRMTGEFVMTQDSAFASLLYDIHKNDWSYSICKLYGVNTDHLAKLVKCTDKVGELREKQAEELGLAAGTAVYGGGGDASLIGVGAGAVDLGDTHIYSGTSGWVSTVVDKSVVDANAMIAATLGARDGYYNYFAELETAAKCVEWVKDHLALDEIGIYLEKNKELRHKHQDREVIYTNLYDYMMAVVNTVPAGSNGVIFTPWLHGNRCPFEDPNARGMFFNISLETGKSEMIRAVVEGVCFHLRWMLETEEKKVKSSDVIRFVGGGALSDVTCQIMADCLGKTIETVDSPQNIGAVGAAATIAVGQGLIRDLGEVKRLIPAAKVFKPNLDNKKIYDRNYKVYTNLYKANKENFAILNGEA